MKFLQLSLGVNIKQFMMALFFGVMVFMCSSVAFASGGHLPSAYNSFANRIKEIEKPIEGTDAIDMTQNLIKEKIIPLGKFLFIGVGLIFLGMYAYRIVLGKGEDDQLKTEQENIVYAAVGFALIALAEPMTKIFDPIGAKDVTQILQQSAFESVITIIINTLEILLGTILVILIFYAGMKLVTADGDEEVMSNAKILLNIVLLES